MASRQRRISSTVPHRSGFHAELDGTDLATLLQIACARGDRSVVEVRSGDDEGYLYLQDGLVVHAHTRHGHGQQAALDMLCWRTGDFLLSDRPWTEESTFSSTPQALILQAAQRLDDLAWQGDSPEAEDESQLTRVVALPPPAPSAQRAVAPPNDPPTVRPVASVRMSQDGQVLHSEGDTSTLSQTTAYAQGLCSLVGTRLGLGDFQALHAKGDRYEMVMFADGTEVVAVQAADARGLGALRRQLGV